ncbi:MAG TPA: tyrosinase family protein [Gemmataceae bacterium]|jgi:hypothetical protein
MADQIKRPEIHSLVGAPLAKLRFAFQKLKGKAGDQGYQALAGIHGLPQFKCMHHTDTGLRHLAWLPWHRAYLLAFETALRIIDPDVALPFWDWTSDVSVHEGLPAAFADETYQPTPGGPAVPNPLLSATYQEAGQQFTTARFVNELDARQQTAGEAAGIYSNTVFGDDQTDGFTEALAIPHDDLHSVWVRGSMGDPTYAAYDPIFWAHHANIDRLWAQWQLGPNNADPSPDVLALNLDPFGKTAADVLDFRQLPYTYVGITPMPQTALLRDAIVVAASRRLYRVAPLTFVPGKQQVLLTIHDLPADAGAFELDFFINHADASSETPLQGNVHYAGSIGVFGMQMKEMPAAKHRHAGMGKVRRRVLDITRPVTALVRPGQGFTLNIVAKDMHGQPFDLTSLSIGRMSITTE